MLTTPHPLRPRRNPRFRRVNRWLATVLLLLPACLASRAAVAQGTTEASKPAGGAGEATSQAPLHERIDALVEQAHVGRPVPLADDAAFLRRVTLDLTGRVPSVERLRAFLADDRPDKRAVAIDQLLSSPAHARYLAQWLDVTLMERAADKHVKSPEWEAYLLEATSSNKPWDQLSREILAGDASDEKLRPAAKFYLDRDGEPNRLTRDVGRVFFGVDLQCAQCHNHPLIDNYLQTDYYGLYAFLNRSFVFTDKDKKVFFAEKAEGEVSYKSVFTEEGGYLGPRLPGGRPLVEPSFARGEEYEVKPAKDVRPVPKHSRRELLAREATAGGNRAFNRNIANRLWAFMMGRGLVEPVDLHHPSNPPSSPELLQLLSEAVVAGGYDIRGFLRELALSQTYQRSLAMPDDLAAQAGEVSGQLASLEAAQQAAQEASVEALKAIAPLSDGFAAAQAKIGPALDAAAKQAKALEPLEKALAEAAGKLSKAEQPVAQKRDQLAALTAALEAAQRAAGRLPEDAELAAAVQQFMQGTLKLTGELKPLEEAAVKLKAAADAARQARDAAQQQLVQLDAQAAEAQRATATAQGDLETKRAEAQQLELVAKARQSRLEAARQLVAHGQLLNQRLAVVGQLADAQAARAATATQLQQLRADEQAAAAELDKLTRDLAQQREEMEAFRGRQTAEAETGELLKQLAAAAAAAQQKLASDAELKKTSERLAAKSQQFAAGLAERGKQLVAMQAEVAQRQAARDSLQGKLEATRQELAQRQAAEQKLGEQLTALAKQQETLDSQYAESDAAITALWAKRFATASLKPLTPEQMAWSLMEVGGLLDRQEVASRAELEKKSPLTDADRQDPQKVAAWERQLEQAVYDKLKGNIATFVKLFGNSAGQPQNEFFATVDQALFVANGGTVRGWLAPSGNNLTARLAAESDAGKLAEELYLGVLGRTPTQEEVADVAGYLEARQDARGEAVQELVWALVASAEFRFNH